MKIALLLASLLTASTVQAAPLKFSLDRVELTQFLSVTYGDALKKNYVLSPELLTDGRKLSLHVEVEKDKLPQFLSNYFTRLGVSTEEKDGVYYLDLAKKAVQPIAPTSAVTPSLLPQQAPAPEHQQANPVYADTVSKVFVPKNRPSEFMANTLNSVFGQVAINAVGRVVITTDKKNLDKVMSIAHELDTLPKKVNVSATFVEVTTNSDKARGFSILASVLGSKLGVSVGSTTGSSISLKGTNFEAVLNAIDTDGRFKQISSPHVVVDEYEKTTLSVGDETPTLSGSVLDKNGNAQQQITYRSSGVILDVQPKVLGDGGINLQIDGQVSSFQSTTTGVNNSPTLIKRQVKTSLTIDDAEVLVIGGLNDNKVTNVKDSLAFLPSMFDIKNKRESKTDLVLILTATTKHQ